MAVDRRAICEFDVDRSLWGSLSEPQMATAGGEVDLPGGERLTVAGLLNGE